MATHPVKCREDSITLPVHPWHDDALPDLFLRLRRWQLVYPYPRNDVIDAKPVRRRFRELVVENEYLRLTVLPELGGHLYSAYDKINRREVFHRCSQLKPGPLGRCGAWGPVGIEFNFPSAHSPTTLRPVDAALRRNPDGSASIVTSDIERVSRMRWSIALTLRPGVNVVEADVTLHNRTDLPQGYYYWANAAVSSTPGTRYILPTTMVEGHGIGSKRDRWPMRDGVDLSWHKNIRMTIAAFASGCREEFFGVYDVEKDWGVAHVADYRALPGKKIFDWGMGPAGVRKSSEFSPPDGPYIEFQAGLTEHQPSYDMLPPHRALRFMELWVPVHGLGAPFTRASAHGAVTLEAEPGKPLRLAVNVTQRHRKARITLSRNYRRVFGGVRDLTPEASWVVEIDAKPNRPDDEYLLTIFQPESGLCIVHHQVGARPQWKSEPKGWLESSDSAAAAEGETAEAHFARGRSFDRMLLPDKARKEYETAIAKDPGHPAARLGMGAMMLRAGAFEQAAKHLRRALERDPDLFDARYGLGLAYAGLWRDDEAADEFWVALRLRPDDVSCIVQLGLAWMRKACHGTAAELLERARAAAPLDTRVLGLLSMALRHTAEERQAAELLSAALSTFPTDHLLLSENRLVRKALGAVGAASRADAQLRKILGRTPETFIELAVEYAAARLWDEALDILRMGIAATSSRGRTYPLLLYHAAQCLDGLHRHGEAARMRRRAARQSPELCFPGRVEDMAALEAALDANPNDAVAAFCLGHFYYARTRRKEAVALWHRALRAMPRSRTLTTLLALAAWEDDKFADTSRWLHRASRLDPDNVALTLWMDSVLTEVNNQPMRRRLLRRAFAAHPEHDDVRERLALLLFDSGRPQDALRLISEHRFRTRHGIYALTRLHIGAHTAVAEQLIARKRWAPALESLEAARNIPIELGEDETRLELFGKVHYLSGLCHENLGRRREARACYLACVGEKRPGLPELLYFDYLSYLKLGRAAEAKAALRKLGEELQTTSKSMDTRKPFVHFLRSRYLAAQGRKREAAAELRMARRLGWRPSIELNVWNRFGFS